MMLQCCSYEVSNRVSELERWEASHDWLVGV